MEPWWWRGLTPEERARTSSVPAWAALVDDVVGALPPWIEQPTPARSEDGRRATVEGFVGVFSPFIERARARVLTALEALDAAAPGRVAPEPLERRLCLGLVVRLHAVVARVLILELHVQRLRDEEAGLTGDGFARFLHRLAHREPLEELLHEYSVLTRRVLTMIEDWADESIELATRWVAAADEVTAAIFGGVDPGALEDVATGAGDRHAQGRAVAILGFSQGAKLVYKPRSLAVDAHFAELVAWLDARGATPPLCALRVVDRGSHGFAEHVAHGPVETTAEVERFYERQGALLALLYALDATDFHGENLIARGEHPVLVDLETLFHARPGEELVDPEEHAGELALAHSVQRSWLLPRRLWANASHAGVDVSGLGDSEGVEAPYEVPVWEGAGTDQMRIVRKRVMMPGSHHRPVLDGRPVDARDHVDAIVRGFVGLYDLLARERAALREPHGPIARFSDDPIRVVLRGTHFYERLLGESHHPDIFRDTSDQLAHFALLDVAARNTPHLRAVSAAELADLMRVDIPHFTTTPASHDLRDSRGARIPGLLARTGLELVTERLNALSPRDRDRQVWIIRASFAAMSELEPSRVEAVRAPTQSVAAVDTSLVELARRAGAHLEATAIRRSGRATWLGLSAFDDAWSVVPLGADLYAGLPGVALFLAHLARATGDEAPKALAREAIATVRRWAPTLIEHQRMIGAFEGWGGLVWAWSHLAVLLGDEALLDEAEAFTEPLAAHVATDTGLDVLAGAAGAIFALRALDVVRPRAVLRDRAIRCGAHLRDHATNVEGGLGWVTKLGPRPLMGFAHGASGIAAALAELAAWTDDRSWLPLVHGALGYEAAIGQGDYPDLRAGAEAGTRVAWCHGAPGAGLARARILRTLGAHDLEAELRATVATTLESGFGRGHCLCHGDAGNLELLLTARRALDDRRLDTELEAHTRTFVEDVAKGWRCGVPQHLEVPGLMTGIAGIGLALLRLADPDAVPSLLTLEAPSAPRS
ncbi:type 2 lantipeptide synthetase LanM family protein [Myxococcota bacterium]|nr:type 2 lantipeptide synthetase LanM family protein [Myxococcota bacterium]